MAAPQPLHIFRKDLMHLWPETLIVLALFVAFAWSAPSGWEHSPYAVFAPILAGFLRVLMPISWLVVISRLIHDESLVGDRQFWTSRPYHWVNLFLSKLLYLAVFLYLPFLLMQMFLLKHAGLYPTTAIGPLFHNLLLLTVLIVVPLTAIAAVTGTFAKMLLSTLGALIYIVILGIAYGFINFQSMPPPSLSWVLTGIFIVLPLAALLYQYATRKTLISRLALVATPFVIFLLLIATPASALIRHAYPVLNGASDPKLTTIPDEYAPKEPKTGPLFTFRGEPMVQVPFAVAGVDKDSNYSISGAAITVDTPTGFHYQSPFVLTSGAINGGTPVGGVVIPMPLDVFNKVKSTPSDLHLSLATEHQTAEPAQTWKATLLPFSVPGHGVCTYSSEDPNAAPTCRYPFKAPDLNHVTAPLAASCDGTNPQTVPGQGNLGGASSLLDFDPVITAPLNLQPRQELPPGVSLQLCPGTSLSFVEAKDAGKARFEVEEKHLLLENYAMHTPANGGRRPGVPPQQSPE